MYWFHQVAIATGRHSLGINEKPSTLSGKQALAAIGQARLIMEYRKLFSEYNLRIAQILMTKSTITNEIYRENAKATFTQLLVYGAVPIVNENVPYLPMRFSLVTMTDCRHL